LILAAAALFHPAAAMAGVLAFWRFGSDLGWTQNFPVATGLFSHWQVWLAILFICEGFAILLNRWGKRKPKVVVLQPAAERDPALAKSNT
jgi:hypothetical protein